MKILRLLLLFSCLLSVLTIAGCQQDGNNSDKELLEVPKSLPLPLVFSDRPTLSSIANQLYLLSVEKRGLVLYQASPTANQGVVISTDTPGQHWLHADGQNIYVFWWTAVDKNKYLKVSASKDAGKSFSKAVTVNTNTGVLAEVSIASNSKGAVAVAYTDEREPGYGVYFNSSTDGGLTWRKTDLRLDQPVITAAMQQAQNTKPPTFANSPRLAFLQDRLVAIWQQVDMTEMGGHVLRVVAKSSTDAGLTWGAESNIFAAPNMQPVEMNIFNNDKNIYLFAMFADDNKGFTGFHNTNPDASTWAEIPNTALGTGFNKRTVSWIKGSFSGENLVLAFTSKPTEGEGKVQANTATLSTSTQQWIAPVKQLDADKGHELTKSTFPDIVDTGTSGLVVVWEDYRTLVPSIYYDISKDHGKTWLPQPKTLTTSGLALAKSPKVILGDDKLWLSYFMVKLDGKKPQGERVYQEFKKSTNGDYEFPAFNIEKPGAEKLKERLIERTNKFWALREESKWEETWNYMEPVYRERFDKAQWLAQQGKISFSKTVVDEQSVVITGNIGILDANVDVSVNQQVSQEGLLESAPPNQQKVNMKWGWFYDDWYFMPDLIFGNHLEY